MIHIMKMDEVDPHLVRRIFQLVYVFVQFCFVADVPHTLPFIIDQLKARVNFLEPHSHHNH